MEPHEREEFKELGYRLSGSGCTSEVRAEGYLMIMTAHFLRNPKAPDFPTYASNWIAANRNEINPEILALLEPRFPACTRRMIKAGYSDWGSYGCSSYK